MLVAKEAHHNWKMVEKGEKEGRNWKREAPEELHSQMLGVMEVRHNLVMEVHSLEDHN